MDVSYINPFITATSQLFATMIQVQLTLGKPSIRKPDDRLFKLYRISAAIDLQGGVSGRVAISLSPQVAYALGGALAGRPFEKPDAELLDAIGEIANMIVGGAKTTLPDGGSVRISTPQVMATHLLEYPAGLPVIIIPFDTPAGRFVLETALRVAAKPASAPTPTPAPTAIAPAAPAQAA